MDADAASKTFLLVAFTVTAALLLLIVSGGVATGTMMSGGLLGSGSAGALSWMWLPNLLLGALGAAIFAVLFDRKRVRKHDQMMQPLPAK